MFSPTNKEFSNENKDKLVENWNRATLILFFFLFCFQMYFPEWITKGARAKQNPTSATTTSRLFTVHSRL